jgi:hypothetical protein
MKSMNAKTWLVVASLALLSCAPVMAQDATSTTTTTTTTAPADSRTPATTTKTKKLKKQKPVKAKRSRHRKHQMTGHQLSGGVSKKSKHGKTYKPISAKQQKRLDKLNSALSSPKQYKKIPELSTPGGMTTTHSSPGL